MERTNFAGLTQLDIDESVYADGGSFLERNPSVIDFFLAIGAKTHRHDEHPALADPVEPPSVTFAAFGGSIGSDTQLAFGYTLVDGDGGETLISPLDVETSQAGIADPHVAPSGAFESTAGDLRSGTYYYGVTLTEDEGGETRISPYRQVVRPPGFASGQIRLTHLSDVMDGSPGATGWRLYRSLNGAPWAYYAAGSGDEFLDDGTGCSDCTEHPPVTNSTLSTGKMMVTVPSAGVGSAVAYRIYGAIGGLDVDLTSPAFVAEQPAASAGVAVEVTDLAFERGAPPPVTLSKGGAMKIDPDRDLVEWHWKRPVATAAELPIDEDTEEGDVRVAIDTAQAYMFANGAWGAWAGGGSGHEIAEDQDPVPNRPQLDFVGLGVDVYDDEENGRTIVTIPGASAMASGVAGAALYVDERPASGRTYVPVEGGPILDPGQWDYSGQEDAPLEGPYVAVVVPASGAVCLIHAEAEVRSVGSAGTVAAFRIGVDGEDELLVGNEDVDSSIIRGAMAAVGSGYTNPLVLGGALAPTADPLADGVAVGPVSALFLEGGIHYFSMGYRSSDEVEGAEFRNRKIAVAVLPTGAFGTGAAVALGIQNYGTNLPYRGRLNIETVNNPVTGQAPDITVLDDAVYDRTTVIFGAPNTPLDASAPVWQTEVSSGEDDLELVIAKGETVIHTIELPEDTLIGVEPMDTFDVGMWLDEDDQAKVDVRVQLGVQHPIWPIYDSHQGGGLGALEWDGPGLADSQMVWYSEFADPAILNRDADDFLVGPYDNPDTPSPATFPIRLPGVAGMRAVDPSLDEPGLGRQLKLIITNKYTGELDGEATLRRWKIRFKRYARAHRLPREHMPAYEFHGPKGDAALESPLQDNQRVAAAATDRVRLGLQVRYGHVAAGGYISPNFREYANIGSTGDQDEYLSDDVNALDAIVPDYSGWYQARGHVAVKAVPGAGADAWVELRLWASKPGTGMEVVAVDRQPLRNAAMHLNVDSEFPLIGGTPVYMDVSHSHGSEIVLVGYEEAWDASPPTFLRAVLQPGRAFDQPGAAGQVT